MKEFKFNDSLVEKNISALVAVGIGPVCVSKEQQDTVDSILGLAEMGEDDLRATRNSIVKIFSDIKHDIRISDKPTKWAEFDAVDNLVSGVTAVIDYRLWEMGAAV